MKIKITEKWLIKMGACCSENDRKQAEKIGELKLIVRRLIKENRLSDANWLISRKLKRMDCVRYAVFAARKVLNLYEEFNKNDSRPRLAIEAAEEFLRNSTKKNKDAAAYAAYAAANAAMLEEILKYGIKLLYCD